MAKSDIFVGRQKELKEFTKVLEDKRGQAIIVIGQAGMGKTWLVNRMANVATLHPSMKCGCVRYELTSGDSVDVVIGRMINDAFHAAEMVEGSFDATALRRKQWYTLFETIVPKGEQLSKLIQSFAREENRPTREQFLERLRLISEKMKDNGRAVFVIDPLEYLDEEKDIYGEEWAVVVRELPKKIKFIFAQRPEDVLARYRKFSHLSNVIMIPAKKLGNLEEQAVDKLLDLRASETEYNVGELRRELARYEGHPYALQGALNLLATGTKLKELPDDPTEQGIIEEQCEKICKFGKSAIQLFKSYAILEVMVPDDVASSVGEVEENEQLALLNSNIYLKKLLHEEGQSKRIYHLLLAKYILSQMSEAEKKKYHKRAVDVYRGRLKKAKETQTKPDELAAVRLPEHILVAEGEEAFVDAFVNECARPLLNLGLLDEAISLSEQALGMVKEDLEKQAAVLDNLGVIYQTRGELDKAEEMLKKSLEIAKKLNLQKVMASDYCNLGLIYRIRGKFNKAEEMHKKSLEISEKLGLQEIMTNDYSNLGIIYIRKEELDKAEEMLKKALATDEKLGQIGEMASDYCNLGVIYQTRGELNKAEEMHKRALEIHKKLGLLWGIASEYGDLGLIYQTRGELDRAEEMHKKSLELSEKFGLQEIMASEYGNLGVIYKQRGDFKYAREYWEKALDLFKRIGMANYVKMMEEWIEGIKGK